MEKSKKVNPPFPSQLPPKSLSINHLNVQLTPSTDIAFSSTYLQARTLGIRISGTNFQILHILSGTEKDIPISTAKESIKICSVAKGRVNVSLGSKKFTIGEGGMWRVRCGEKCIVANQLSLHAVAVVHVCAVEG